MDRPSESKGNAVMKDTAVLISALDGVQYMVESLPTVSESDFTGMVTCLHGHGYVRSLSLRTVGRILRWEQMPQAPLCVYVCVPLRASICERVCKRVRNSALLKDWLLISD